MLIAGTVLFLTACSTQPITENSTSIWDRFVIYNVSQFIIWLSELFGQSYGMGIIVFTILTRILLLPLMHFQYKSTRKTAVLQPKIKELRAQYSSRDRETQARLQEEINALYEKEGINQFAGCLPLVIQLPIMLALYESISRTEILRTGHFLWLNLGTPDPYFIIPVLAAIFTFLTSWLSMKMQSAEGIGMIMNIVLSVIIFTTALGLPSALGLYWVTGNVVSVIQTLIMNNPFKFQREQTALAKAKRDRERALEKAKHPKKKRK